MATNTRRAAWWSIGFNATLVVLNIVLVIAEFFRDDMRWWRFLLSGALILLFGRGLLAGVERLRRVGSDVRR